MTPPYCTWEVDRYWWCSRQDSNLWPLPSEGSTLSSWATGANIYLLLSGSAESSKNSSLELYLVCFQLTLTLKWRARNQESHKAAAWRWCDNCKSNFAFRDKALIGVHSWKLPMKNKAASGRADGFGSTRMKTRAKLVWADWSECVLTHVARRNYEPIAFDADFVIQEAYEQQIGV